MSLLGSVAHAQDEPTPASSADTPALVGSLAAPRPWLELKRPGALEVPPRRSRLLTERLVLRPLPRGDEDPIARIVSARAGGRIERDAPPERPRLAGPIARIVIAPALGVAGLALVGLAIRRYGRDDVDFTEGELAGVSLAAGLIAAGGLALLITGIQEVRRRRARQNSSGP